MRASEAIKQLQALIDQHGDLPIVGGYLSEDTPLGKIIALDDEGCDVYQGCKAESFFLT